VNDSIGKWQNARIVRYDQHRARLRDQNARVAVITNGIRSFTTTPYVFTSLERARAYMGTSPSKVSYFLVHVSPNTDIDGVRKRLLANLSKVEVLTPSEFRSRSRTFWLFGTVPGPPFSRARCLAPSSVR
jgi:putative ABC transport system permease protein